MPKRQKDPDSSNWHEMRERWSKRSNADPRLCETSPGEGSRPHCRWRIIDPSGRFRCDGSSYCKHKGGRP